MRSGSSTLLANYYDTCIVRVLKIDVLQTETNTCGRMQTVAALNLTTNSYWAGEAGGSVQWESAPSGLSITSTSNTNFVFNPSNSVPTQYIVKAFSSLLTNCMDVATVRVWRVEMTPHLTNVCIAITNVTLRLTNSYWSGSGVEWTSTPAGLAGEGHTDSEYWFNPSNSVPTQYMVRAWLTMLTNCYDTCTVRVIKVDIEQAETNICWNAQTNAVLNLTSNSYWVESAGGSVVWTSTPSGLAVLNFSNTNFVFNPSNSVPTSYVVAAWSSLLTNCLDTCTVRVLKIDVEQTETNICWHSQTNVTLNLTADSYWAESAGGGVVWTSAPSGLANVGYSNTNFWFSPSNSTPTSYVVTAWSSLLTNCLDTCTVRVIKVESVNVHSSDTNTYKIASVLTNGMDHFVCVKDTGDIILDAVITPTNAVDAITWEADGATITSPAVSSDKATAKLSSATSQKIAVRINVGSCTCWSGTVWVVWATTGASGGTTTSTTGTVYSSVQSYYIFTQTISPTTIITDSDRPALSGGKSDANLPPSVPAGETNVYRAGIEIKTGASLKWDDTRQMRIKIENPSGISFANAFYNDVDGLSLWKTYPSWPSGEVVGNDDKWDTDEDDNPYDSPQGQVTGEDTPQASIRHAEGSVGDTVENKKHFRQYLRIELFGHWYRASDFFLWRQHAKFRKVDEAADGVDYNGNGATNDHVWINNGSDAALDNTGW